MARRKYMGNEQSPAASEPEAVQVIFDPAGDILVRAKPPSGNVYEVVPRVSFQIASEDVDWFFHSWEWEHRQRLSLAEDYQPRQPQFNNGRQMEARPDRPQFDNGAASVPAPEAEADPLTALLVEPEPVDQPAPEAETPEETVDATDPEAEPEPKEEADDEAPVEAPADATED